MDWEQLLKILSQPFEPKVSKDDLHYQIFKGLNVINTKSFNEKELTYESIITAQITDRDNEGVLIRGLDLEQYRSTPVIGFVHFMDKTRGFLPIGGTLDLKVIPHPIYNVDALWTKNKLIDDKSELMQTIIKCLSFTPPILAESIGFMASEVSEVTDENSVRANWRDAQRIFTRSILLEHSLCPVVSNQISTVKDLLTSKELEMTGFDRILFGKKCVCPKTMVIIENNPLAEVKGVIPYKQTSLANKDESWDGAKEVADASVDDLKIMCTYFDEEKPDIKSSYKLPHHKVSGEHACVFRGCSAAMGRLGQTDMPASAVDGCYNHLAKHYKDFDVEPPAKSVIENLRKLFEVKEKLTSIDTQKYINQVNILILQEVIDRLMSENKLDNESRTFLASMASHIN
jgi:hypothetical protein